MVGVRRERHLDVTKATPQSAMLTAPLNGSQTKPLLKERCLKGREVANDRRSFAMLPPHSQLR